MHRSAQETRIIRTGVTHTGGHFLIGPGKQARPKKCSTDVAVSNGEKYSFSHHKFLAKTVLNNPAHRLLAKS